MAQYKIQRAKGVEGSTIYPYTAPGHNECVPTRLHDPADVDAFADSLAVYRNGMIRHVLDDYPARRASEPDALSLLAPLVEV